MSSFEGHLDEVHDGYVTGWAWDPETPDIPVLIAVWTDKMTRPVYGRASAYRRDLELSGKGSGNCGFQISIDCKDSERVHAKIMGSQEELIDSPVYIKAVAAIVSRDLPLHRNLLQIAASRIIGQMLDE